MQIKTIVVTGAAGQLGTEIVRKYILEGYLVWCCDISESVMMDKFVQSDIDINKIRMLGFDIGSPEQVKEAFNKIRSESSKIDILINNAAIAVFEPYFDRSFDDFMNVLRINVGGTFLCIREAINMMDEKLGGSIVNIGSIYGVVSSNPAIYTDCNRFNSEVYSASKAAVIQMTKYFAVHCAPKNIRVNCVSPGGVFNHQGSDFVSNYSKLTPVGRMATPQEIVAGVFFMASDQARYLTGHNLAIDGGFTSW